MHATQFKIASKIITVATCFFSKLYFNFVSRFDCFIMEERKEKLRDILGSAGTCAGILAIYHLWMIVTAFAYPEGKYFYNLHICNYSLCFKKQYLTECSSGRHLKYVIELAFFVSFLWLDFALIYAAVKRCMSLLVFCSWPFLVGLCFYAWQFIDGIIEYVDGEINGENLFKLGMKLAFINYIQFCAFMGARVSISEIRNRNEKGKETSPRLPSTEVIA